MNLKLRLTAGRIAVAALAFHVAGALPSAAQIHDQIGIDGANNNAAIRRCAEELVKRSKSISSLAPNGLRAVPIKEIHWRVQNQSITGKYVPPFIYVTDRSHASDLIKVPFAFRDAEHVLAFLRSGEFYQQIRDNPDGENLTGNPRLAIAYGGFFQIFSKAAAVTEPKHFYGRSIGGTIREPELYRQFGARINPGSGISGMYTDLDQRAASEFDHRETQIVEAHLASAIENGFKGKGRFVNLVTSSMLAVDILVWTTTEKVDQKDLVALRAWADAAAAACSEANYQKELDTLEELKADGYQIVPFNRNAFVEHSWRAVLENSHEYWTIEHFDKLVRLGNSPKGGLLPSALLSKMSPQKRKQALDHDANAKSKIAGRLLRDK